MNCQQENGYRVYKCGVMMSPGMVEELSKLNAFYPMNSSLFDETYIRKLVRNVKNIQRKDVQCALKGKNVITQMTIYVY